MHPENAVLLLNMLDGRRPLSDLELIHALVDFANTGSARDRAKLQASVSLDQSELDGLVMDLRVLEAAGQSGDGGQHALQEALAMVVESDVPVRVLASWRRRAAGVVLRPTFGPHGARRFQFAEFEEFATGLRPAFCYVLLLLLEAPFAGNLCRCKFCGRFFFAARPSKPSRDGKNRGAPVREYCPGTDHRALARKAEAKERMRALRAERRAEAKQPKRRRR